MADAAPLKRYALFGYDAYYPGGGWSDFIDSFDTFVSVKKARENGRDKYPYNRDYYELIDLYNGQEIDEKEWS